MSNILRNLAWLMGGKGFGAVCSIVYLAILSRSLGIKDFGHFSLIFATGQALVAIAGFQTWQTVVRFGAERVHRGEWERLGRLAWFCGRIDLTGAVLGCATAGVLYYGFGQALGLNPKYVDMAFAFNCALMWSRMTTPNGLLRVLDRFDLSTYAEAVVPAGRLIAAAVIVATGPSVGKFLFAWAFFDLLSAALLWLAAWRVAPQALHRSQMWRARETLAENPGLPKFFGITFVSSTLDAIYKQGPLLAVGYFLGTSAAGLYRLADQLAQGIGKLAQLIARAVFPEFAMARARAAEHDFRALVLRVSAMAAAAGVTVTLATMLAGEHLLGLIGGADFMRGAPVLVPIAIGASFELAAVSFEPVLYSTGHALYPVIVRALAVTVLVIGVLSFIHLGPLGVAWSVAAGLAFAWLAMALTVRAVLRQPVPAT